MGPAGSAPGRGRQLSQDAGPESTVGPLAAADLDAAVRLAALADVAVGTASSWTAGLADPAMLQLVARRGEEVVGVATALVAGDVADVHVVAVEPRVRRRGIGGRLVAALVAAAADAGAERIVLDVRAGNGSAIAMYEQAGFRPAGRRPGYYRDGEDALVMACDLGASHTA